MPENILELHVEVHLGSFLFSDEIQNLVCGRTAVVEIVQFI